MLTTASAIITILYFSVKLALLSRNLYTGLRMFLKFRNMKNDVKTFTNSQETDLSNLPDEL